MTQHIAIDIGGTQIRAACYEPHSITPVRIQRTSTQGDGLAPLERLKNLIVEIWPDDTVASIGVAAPGPLDPFRGVILSAPNIPGWVNLPLQQELQSCFGVPVALGNDANLAVLGEWQFGAGQGHHNVLYLTVSTGIGGGVIVDDRLLLGARGLAAELGHVTVLAGGPVCGCGQRGHLEALASGTALTRWTEEQIAAGVPTTLPKDERLKGKMISRAAEAGDELALRALARAGEYLGIGVADFLHIFNPTAVIIGGGVSQSGMLLMGPMRASLEKHVMTPGYLEDLVLTTAALGDEAGLMGALALARSLNVG